MAAKRTSVTLVVLALALAAAGCKHGGGGGDADGGLDGGGWPDGGTVDPIVLPDFTPPEQDTVLGRVVNLDGVGLEGVTVSAGTITATTNHDGFYALAEVAPAERIVVRFSHPGYAETTRTATMFPGGLVVANAVLVRRQPAVTVDARTGGTVAVAGGSVALEQGAVVDGSGAAVDGPVQLQVSPIGVGRSTIEAAPGDFTALTAAGENGQLESFGMAEYRLLDEQGQELELAAGKPASIELLLPADTALTEGETVPAWHFEEETGRWVESGNGVVRRSSGDPARLAFVAEVPHFSTWNCDKTYEVTCLAGRVLQCDGTPAAGADLLGSGVDYSGTSRAFAGNDGSFCMQVRRNSTVQLAAASGYGASRLVTAVSVTTPDTNSFCPGPCQQVDLTLPCTPQEATVDCDDTFFAGCRACVRGRVVDGSGAPVAAVLKVTSGRSTLTALSDEHGEYCAAAGLGSLATIVATARGGQTGMATVTPATPGACPACAAAPDIVVDASSSSSEELDFGQCPTTIGGMTVDDVRVSGAPVALAGLDTGWLLPTYLGREGQPEAWMLSFHFVSSAARGFSGVPLATAVLRLDAPPAAGQTYTLEALPEGVELNGDALSLSGGMTGLANELYDLDPEGGLARAEIVLERGFREVGDPVRGRYTLTFGPQCALPGSTVTFSGTFDTALREQPGLMPTIYDVNSPEFAEWQCGMFDLLVWATSLTASYQGAAQLELDGGAVTGEDDPLIQAAYSWVQDRFALSYHASGTSVTVQADHPQPGTTALSGGSLMLEGGCYYSLAEGLLELDDFEPASDTWFTGSLHARFTKVSYSEGDCPDHTVDVRFGAAVCR